MFKFHRYFVFLLFAASGSSVMADSFVVQCTSNENKNVKLKVIFDTKRDAGMVYVGESSTAGKFKDGDGLYSVSFIDDGGRTTTVGIDKKLTSGAVVVRNVKSNKVLAQFETSCWLVSQRPS